MAAGAAMCPGQNESAGKRYSGKTRKGNRYLRATLIQAGLAAMRKNGLFQVLTDHINAALTMPRPMTALLTQCGEAKAFYNPDRGEAVLCYELLGALLLTAP